MTIAYLEVCGGLGNQLFQIFAILAVSRKLDLQPRFAKLTSAPSVFNNRQVYWTTLFAHLPLIETQQHHNFLHRHQDHDPIWGYREIILPTTLKETARRTEYKQFVRFDGYYQHRLHFWFCKEQLIQQYLPSLRECLAWTPLDRFAKKYLRQDLASPIAFLHIRRGDYKLLQQYHNVLSISYYEVATMYYPECTRFLVFCERDDFSTVQHELDQSTLLRNRIILDETLIVECPDYQQMIFMSMCPRGGILANSTFSVWAGYLHRSKTGRFVYPSRFFAHVDETQSPQIFDPTWICLRHDTTTSVNLRQQQDDVEMKWKKYKSLLSMSSKNTDKICLQSF